MPQTAVVGEGEKYAFVVECQTLDLAVAKAVLLDDERFALEVVGIEERDALVG